MLVEDGSLTSVDSSDLGDLLRRQWEHADDQMGLRIARDLALPDQMRAELAKPFGKVVTTPGFPKAVKGSIKLIIVGDVCTQTARDLKVPFDLAIVDFKTLRSGSVVLAPDADVSDEVVVKVRSPQAMITVELTGATPQMSPNSGCFKFSASCGL